MIMWWPPGEHVVMCIPFERYTYLYRRVWGYIQYVRPPFKYFIPLRLHVYLDTKVNGD